VTADARRRFDPQDVTIACAVALLAQLVFVAAFSMPSPRLVQADISNDNAQPIAVAITPVLKLGSKNPAKVPRQWQRRRPVAAKSQPAALPSPQAQQTPEAIPTTSVAHAPVAPTVVDAAAPEQSNLTDTSDAGAVATAASAQGSEQGSDNGSDTLEGRAADLYKEQLAAWFIARFHIRGKIPYDKLKTLHAVAVVHITPDRKVAGFSIAKPSGNDTFDAEVKATLERAQSSGAELPAPPPMYPQFLARSQSLMFECTVRKYCE
jgi:outer membrane biosynthesis protein TonB